MREAKAARGKPIAGGQRWGRGSSGDDDSDVEEPGLSGYGTRRSGSAGGSSGASGGGGKRKAGTPHPQVKQKGGGARGGRGRKRPPATPEVIDLADSDEEDSDEEGGGSGSSDDGGTSFRATGISSRRGKVRPWTGLQGSACVERVGWLAD